MNNVKSTEELLRFKYKNWKGEEAIRTVIPIRIVVKSSPYHNDNKPCWIMVGFDTEKEALRDFALSGIIEYYSII